MSALIYALGTIALVICDVVVTRLHTSSEIALWAESRALVGILGVVAALGLDLVMVRSPHSSSRMLGLAVVQIPFVAAFLGYVVHSLGYLTSSFSAALLAAGSASGLVLGQFYRAHHRYLASQMIQQGWKIVVFMVLGLTLLPTGLPQFQIDLLLGIVLLATSLAGLPALERTMRQVRLPQTPESPAALYGIGLRFMATSLILALAVYGEQLLVSGVGTAHDAAVFFTHATYFLFPVSVLNGYLGFRIGPWLRDNHDRFVRAIESRWILIGLGAVVYALVMHIIGWVGWGLVKPGVGDPDPWLQLAMLGAAVARTLYTIPSGYNGVFGSPKQHDLLIVLQVLLLLFLGGLVFAVVGYVEIVYLVAFVGAANWVLRTLIGGFVTRIIIKSKLNG